MIEFKMTNEQLQIAIDAAFEACNSSLQEQTTGGKARVLALAHLEALYKVQALRSEMVEQ